MGGHGVMFSRFRVTSTTIKAMMAMMAMTEAMCHFLIFAIWYRLRKS
jgi:hypothetical protein